MEPQEKTMIDGLFDRLRQAEDQTGPRDAQAEAVIREAVARQPAAPYYMAQAILVQEHALQALNARVQELEQELTQRPAGGGFLGGLFGGGTRPPAQTRPAASLQGASLTGASQFQQARGGFLGGALQTAAAVAGGVLLGNAIAGLFADEAHAAEPPPVADEPMNEPMDDGGAFDDFDDDSF